MRSDDVKSRVDYKIVIRLIEKVLETTGPNGSIAFGKGYASKYKNLIDEMLFSSSSEIDENILNEMKAMVDTDLENVRKDSQRRVRSTFTDSNNEMMGMIVDFVKSL
jgi:hypothetical protein